VLPPVSTTPYRVLVVRLILQISRFDPQMVRDVLPRRLLGSILGASLRNPPDGVTTRLQRRQEEVVPLFGARARPSSSACVSLTSKRFFGWELRVEEWRRAARRAGEELGRIGDFEAVDPHGNFRGHGATAAVCAQEFLCSGVGIIVQKCEVGRIDEREEQRFSCRNRATAFGSAGAECACREPDLVHLSIGAMLAGGIEQRILRGRNRDRLLILRPLPSARTGPW
jgi:hypothetical protein